MFRSATMLTLLTLFGCHSNPPGNAERSSPADQTATVVSYERNVQWDHFDDGSFATYDQLTLKLDSNESVSVAVSPEELPDDSAFRIPGTRFTFTLTEPLDAGTHLAWGAIADPVIIE